MQNQRQVQGGADRHLLEVGYDHLSDESQYFRFLAARHHLTAKELDVFTSYNGPDHVATVLSALSRWFDDRDYESTDQARGSLSQRSIPNPQAFERSNYAQTLASFGSDH